MITPHVGRRSPQRAHVTCSNLLVNAWKFAPDHGAVQIQLKRIGDRVQVIVRDTGIGIREDLLPRIFDRFQQGDSSLARPQSGLGLGLAIVKHLVEQHVGQMSPQAAVLGCGSGGHADVSAVPRWPHGLGRSRPIVDQMLLSGVNVLVVEDESDSRATLRAVLEQTCARPTGGWHRQGAAPVPTKVFLPKMIEPLSVARELARLIHRGRAK